jgi:ATP-dependent helicase/nuclease subunit B
MASGADGLSVLSPADGSEEAAAIAVRMRDALETKGKSAALVTPDRSLARRVAAELGRWKIEIDDSGGRPLARMPPGAFLCLLAEAAQARFAPVPLIALLKHPLSLLERPPGEFRRFARELDLVLRGPRPDPGLKGIESAILSDRIKERSARLTPVFAALAEVLGPLEQIMNGQTADLDALLAAHLSAAERLSQDHRGASALWDEEAGEAGANFIADLKSAVADLPPIEADNYAAVFRNLAEEVAVRPAYGRHPRLAILSPREARLQTYDLFILAGLNEGVWPGAVASDPWLSRPMRATLGLEAPERAIGLAAHDFATLAASPNVVLTRALKTEGTPTVASRWLQRLMQFANGLKIDQQLAPCTPYAEIARALGDPGPPKRIARPSPTPPVAARPRKLSVTETESWLRDPYGIYAKRILKLLPLDPLDAPIGPLERGTIVHRALESFVRRYPSELDDAAVEVLIAIADDLFREFRLPKATTAIWRPRFAAAARLFVALEHERRSSIGAIHVEVTGERKFDGPAGEFVLHGRADRIDVFKSGSACIIDYKTGEPPSEKQVKALVSPQLPLEAAMLCVGGFADIGARPVEQLAYMRIGSSAEPVQFRPLNVAPGEIAEKAATWLTAQIARFDHPGTGYVSRALAFRRAFAGDYDHLARVKEWTAAQEEDPEDGRA